MDICRASSNNKITQIHIKEMKTIIIKDFFCEFQQNQGNKKYMFENLEKFSTLLSMTKEITELKAYNSDTYKYSRICNSINKIIRSRRKVKELFILLSEELKCEELKQFGYGFDKALLEWEYVNLLFTRYTMNFDLKYLRKASKSIEKIKNLEIDLYNQLERVEI